MSSSNEGHRNEYDIPNEYEQEPRGTSTSVPSAASVPRPSVDAFQPRNLATAALYTPTLGGTRRDRRRAEDHIEGLHIANQVAGAAEILEQGLTKLEEAHQQRELVQLRRMQLPAKIEAENLELGHKLLQGRTDFEAMAEQQHEERVKRDRLRQIKAEDFAATMHRKRAERLEAEARERSAAAYAAHAEEIGRRQAEAAFHKASETAFEKEADAETQRRRRDQERHRRGQATSEQSEDVPEDLRGPLATERTMAQSREWVMAKIAQIKKRAQAEGRPLSPQELEQIDQYQDALEEGEASIRRRGASDL
jgi:hypothetical protein